MKDDNLKRESDPREFWKYKLPKVEIVDNHEFYSNIVSGKKVLHIGCTDHKELIDTKIRKNEYLHTKLIKKASLIHGIDVNKEAIDYLKNKYNISDLYYYDVTHETIPSCLLKKYDIILVPEVLEHVLNLGNFLQAIKKFMSSESLLIVSTPNAFKSHSFFTVLKGYEETNPDHKYYFSYVTLKSLLEECGFMIEKWQIYIYGDSKRKLFKYGRRGMQNLIKSLLIERSHWFGDGIVIQCRIRK